MSLFTGYKIEAPKLEFGDTKHSDYILKPEYHKLTSDYSNAAAAAAKSQNDFLLKTSEYSQNSLKASAEYLSKSGDNYPEHDNLTSYNEKYFHPKQFWEINQKFHYTVLISQLSSEP